MLLLHVFYLKTIMQEVKQYVVIYIAIIIFAHLSLKIDTLINDHFRPFH